jgi:aminopeptidase N
MPSEEFLAERQDRLDVDALINARDRLRLMLANRLKKTLLNCHQAAPQRAWSFTPGEVGRRRMRNACLAWLSALDEAEVRQLCLDQYRKADNMTDRIAALQCLNQHASAERDNALFDFYTRNVGQPLVLDKWFALQAGSPVAGAVARVRMLREHALFDARVPNRVRAVFSSFSQQNMRSFHAADGSGYRLIADQVLALDTLNPQVAARLASCLISWRRIEGARREQMRGELERILGARGLSTDVQEIVSQGLKTSEAPASR